MSASSEHTSVVFVKQAHALLMRKNNSENLKGLITSSLAPCIGVAMQNRQTGDIMLAHVDDNCTKKSVVDLVSKIRKTADDKILLYFTGGEKFYYGPEGGKCYLEPIIKEISSQTNVEVMKNSTFEVDRRPLGTGTNLAIDIEGNVFFGDDANEMLKYTRPIEFCHSSMTDINFHECTGLPSDY